MELMAYLDHQAHLVQQDYQEVQEPKVLQVQMEFQAHLDLLAFQGHKV